MGTIWSWHFAQGNCGCSEGILTLPPPIKTPSEVSVAHLHSTRTPSQHHWGHVSSMFCLHWGLEPRTFHFSAQSPTDWATTDVLKVHAKWWAEAPVPLQLLSQSITYSPQSPSPAPLPLYFTLFLLRPPCSSVLMLKLNPRRVGCKWDFLWGGRKRWEKKLNAKNYDLHNKKWGVGQNDEWVTKRGHEKIHMSPNLCQASASASEINLHNESIQHLNQLNLLAKDNIVNRTGWCH